MFTCQCGASFENKISCSRHKATCMVYRSHIPVVKNTFSIEGKDHVVCKVCNYKARDLARHLVTAQPPHLSLSEYRAKFPNALLVCTDVNDKRRATSLNMHGTETYRNRDAQSIGVRIAYADGGVIKRVRATKLARYGDAGYVNVEKRLKTIKERYGVDNPMKDPNIVKKALETKKILYGDNPIQRPPAIEKDILEKLYLSGKTLGEIGLTLNVSEAVISYWMKKHSIKVSKKIVSPKNKEYLSPKDIVLDYLNWCLKQNILLSFYEYASLTESKRAQRMKRLFNTGRSYNHLLDELRDIALQPDKWSPFLEKINHD